MDSLKIASIQMVSGTQLQQNLDNAYELIYQAKQQANDWIVLPEYWPLMGQQDTDKLSIAEEFGQGLIQETLSQWANEFKIILFAGSIPLLSEYPQQVYNSLLTFNQEGKCISRYDKMHLFSFTGLGEAYDEAKTIVAGTQIPQLNIDGIPIAQGICYDLRFPEFFRAQLPHNIMILPAAFTNTTGQAHWEILLKARAIENQCFVIASAQGGTHQNGRKTFGHSMVIDPWGNTIAQQNHGSGVISAQLSLQKITSIRSKLPALKNRKIN